MKKVGLWAFFLIFLLSFSFFASKSYAGSETLTASPSSRPDVNYELPYPGLLPDSPIYFLRVTRDRIIGFLISDPLKKTEFDLLQADKRLNAGIYLLAKGKTSLALSTVSKAENYFEQAINEMNSAKKQGRTVSAIEGRMKDAVVKHRQELEKFVKNADSNFRESFENQLQRVILFEERLFD